jgi:hypothetical protein
MTVSFARHWFPSEIIRHAVLARVNEHPHGGYAVGKKSLAAQSWEQSERRRLIRLLSAGWLPPSVSSAERIDAFEAAV